MRSFRAVDGTKVLAKPIAYEVLVLWTAQGLYRRHIALLKTGQWRVMNLSIYEITKVRKNGVVFLYVYNFFMLTRDPFLCNSH